MKKKHIKHILTLLALLSMVSFTYAQAIINGITYNLDSTTHTAEVTFGGSYSGSIVIPSSVILDNGDEYSVTTIGSSAFSNCSGLTSATIPNSVISIGSSAFYGCSKLTEITIPNNVTTIGNYTFYKCSGLTEVTIPNSVTEIGYYAFYECSSLTSVKIPDSVTEIGNHAFMGCSSLTSVTMPNTMVAIGDVAFSSCKSLTEIIIPNGVTEIGLSAFSFCSPGNSQDCTEKNNHSHSVLSDCPGSDSDSYVHREQMVLHYGRFLPYLLNSLCCHSTVLLSFCEWNQHAGQ